MRVVNYIHHPPNYSQKNKPKDFPYHWEQEDGTFCGFEPYEWSDLLGEQVKKLDKAIIYEVWQPDVNANNLYEVTLPTGVIRKIFPAKRISYKFIFGKREGLFSKQIIENVNRLNKEPFVLHLNNWRDPFIFYLLEYFKNNPNVKIFISGHGNMLTPLRQILITKNHLKSIPLLIEHYAIKKYFKSIDMISEQNDEIINILQKFSKKNVLNLTMGCDFDFWKPISPVTVKKTLRGKYNIPSDDIVLLTGSFFINRKQIDLFIKILNEIKNDYPFKYILIGKGEEKYVDYLKSLGENLIKENKLIILPYGRDEKLRELYWLSDVYVSTSQSEGASVAIMQAMACGLKIFSTDAGGTSDFMKKNNANYVIPKNNPRIWKKKLIEMFDNRDFEPVSNKIYKSQFDWKVVAGKFINVYNKLLN